MDALFDHEITEQLHDSARSLVYRARAADGRALIVKLPNQEFPSFQQLAQFKREYAIARRCDHPGVVRPLALRLCAGRWTMVQEDIGGVALDRLLRARLAGQRPPDRPALPLEDFFDIALQSCAALEAVHAQGVIHKDINPSNLVWNDSLRRLQLIDFGIACELPHESQAVVHPQRLEGTLRYMAPEQTGRMNRRIDYRADYYALGATFYELLAGQPPFEGSDEMELVHCHLARSPDWSLPVFAALPGTLLAILRRLMEKSAELRYQSLQVLRKDLDTCYTALSAPASAQVLDLSAHHGRFAVPQTLHGREHPIGALLDAFERTASGTRELLLVSGYSGIGKSAVVNEVHKPIVARRGCFIAGKFDQFQRDLPYASLVHAFQGLLRQLLGEPEEVLHEWGGRLRDALGPGLGVMSELIPQLELVAGPADAPPALPPEQAQLRLARVFPLFVDVFAGAGHPLVLFVDDLQWADEASLRMLERLLTTSQAGHLLVIGAYRDNEVGPKHPLHALREALRAGGIRHSTLALAPLTEAQVAHMVSATVRVVPLECAALARLCFRKTGGNPFFLNQFLATIHEAGHLRYLAGADRWDWDLAAIEQAAYTDNVVDLLLDKIRRLPAPAQRLLQLAAAIGNRFTLDRLAMVSERSAWDTQQDLWPALEAGLIQPLDGRYKYVAPGADETGVGYRFLHDRVQQAAYLAVDAEARAANHLRIGRLLLRDTAPARQDELLFEIVEQLNAGRALIDDAGERLQLARLNLIAGEKARRSAAFRAALASMRTGLELLPDAAWRSQHELWLDLRLGEAQAAYVCGEFDCAEAIYPLLRARCSTPLAQARVIAVQAYQYQLQGRLDDAIAVQREGLALLGFEIPAEPAQRQTLVDGAIAEAVRLIGNRAPEELLAAGELRDPVAAAAMQMMHGLWMAGYYAGQQDVSALMVGMTTALSLREGISDVSAISYVAYAFFVTQQSGDPERGRRFGAMALALARSRPNLQARIQTALMFAAMVQHWTRPLRDSDPLYEEALGWALETGDFVQFGVVTAVRATDRIIFGDYLPDLLQTTSRDLALMRANGQQAMADCCLAASIQPVKVLMGAIRPASYDDPEFDEAAFLDRYGGSRLYHAYFLQGKIRNAYLFDTPDAEALAGQRGVVTQIMRGQAKVTETTFYAALILVRALRRDRARPDYAALLEQATTLHASLAQWAAHGPHDIKARAQLVEAELARLAHDLTLATRLYQQAVDAAGLACHVNLQALANELCGESWLDQGQPRVAAVFLKDAIAHYDQWGAQGKVAQLRARHGSLLWKMGGRTGQSASTTHGAAALDLVSLLKATRALSNEIGLRNVLQRLIGIVRENAGGQVARLLLLSDGGCRLEAESDGDAVTVLQSRLIELDADADPQFPLSVLRYVIRTGAEVIEDEIATASRFAADPYVRRLQPRAVMCLPIRQGGRIEGILYFENRLAAGSFTEEGIEFLRTLGAQAMTTIASARLHDSLEQRVAERTAQLEEANRKLAALSITDGLTGLANRRHFDEVLRAECARAARAGDPLALIILDVDYFKRYNDHYGHQAGDACLVSVAQCLLAGTRRASDLTARYGGEEFCIVLPATGAGDARQIAESLRAAVEALAIAHAGSRTGQVTISVGVAVQPAGDEADPAALLRLADAALYRAKDAGRNRVILGGDAQAPVRQT